MPDPRKRHRDEDCENYNHCARPNKITIRYKIHFEGHSSKWPEQCEAIFRSVEQIKRLRINQGRSDRLLSSSDIPIPAKTLQHVIEVVESARRNAKIKSNEETLRLRMEPLIFRSLLYETDCRICRSQYWASDSITEVSTPAYDQQERENSLVMAECDCPRAQRSEQVLDGIDYHVFSDRCSMQVEHDFEDEIPGYPIPCRKPDRVFGLNVTSRMKGYIQKTPDLKHTPFTGADDIVYPFLVCEAKAGVHKFGMLEFEKIDDQTAFPIRSCLKLQPRLFEATKAKSYPSVWYMPYSGDYWKLAACVMQGDEVKIYSLWKGSTQIGEEALQLLSIVDFIVEWARDTFRDAIFSNLAHHSAMVRKPAAMTLAQKLLSATTAKSMHFSPKQRTNNRHQRPGKCNTFSGKVRTGLPARRARCEEDIISVRDESQVPDTTRSVSSIVREVREGDSSTIRFANVVTAEFVRITIPDHEPQCKKLLRSFFIKEPTEAEMNKKAHELLHLFTSSRAALTLVPDQIDQLKRKWLGTGSAATSASKWRFPLVQSWIRFDTHFDRETWQVVQRLTCVSCSAASVKCLVNITSLKPSVPPPIISLFDKIQKTTKSIRCLPNEFSTLAALQNQSLFLERCSSADILQWQHCERDQLNTFNKLVSYAGTAKLTRGSSMYRKRTNLVEIRQRIPDRRTVNSLGLQSGMLDSAILLRKPSNWPQDTEKWCLLLLKQLEINSEFLNVIEEVWASIFTNGQSYKVQNGRNQLTLSPFTVDHQSEESLKIVFSEGWRLLNAAVRN